MLLLRLARLSKYVSKILKILECWRLVVSVFAIKLCRIWPDTVGAGKSQVPLLLLSSCSRSQNAMANILKAHFTFFFASVDSSTRSTRKGSLQLHDQYDASERTDGGAEGFDINTPEPANDCQRRTRCDYSGTRSSKGAFEVCSSPTSSSGQWR